MIGKNEPGAGKFQPTPKMKTHKGMGNMKQNYTSSGQATNQAAGSPKTTSHGQRPGQS